MLKRLALRNFTVFEEVDLSFSAGLNVIIGENGTGKTHLLKIAYALSNAHQLVKSAYTDEKIEHFFSERLLNIFKPDRIGSLVTSGSDGKSSVSGTFEGYLPTATITMPGEAIPPPPADFTTWRFEFSNRSNNKISLQPLQDRLVANAFYGKGVYLPCKETVSFFEGFLALYEKRELQFDETYRDLALHLSTTKLKTPPEFLKREFLALYNSAEGHLELQNGKFYLISGKSKREITLVAEGVRKIAMLLYLLENGSLEIGDTLFWDEPETNLNSKLIKDVAKAVLFLCKYGIQVVLATHSLFLLREIEILLEQKQFSDIPQRYFALGKIGELVNVAQGDSPTAVDPFVLLEEDLAQSERFIRSGESE